METFIRWAPILAILATVSMFVWNWQDGKKKSAAKALEDAKEDADDHRDVLRADTLAAWQSAQAENARLRNDLDACRQEKLDLRFVADENKRLKEENAILRSLNRQQK